MSFFKPEDFWNSCDYEDMANKANRILNEHGVRVYGVEYDETGIYRRHTRPQDTHQALLVCIEELPKKECKHEATMEYPPKLGMLPRFTCANCSVQLVAKSWEPV